MKTLVINKDKSLEIKEVPKPKITATQALVKTIACGMCGSDVKLIHQGFKGYPTSAYPLMLGHEGVGEVIEIGSDVKGLKPGDKVFLPFVDPDKELFDDLNSAWGALSEYAVVHDLLAYEQGKAPAVAYAQTILDPELDPVDAVMLITFREVLSNIKYFGVAPKDSIVIYGCGPVGLTFIKFLSLLGVKEIIAIDIFDEKLQTAGSYGATKLINSKTQNDIEAIRRIYPNGVDFVLDAIGGTAFVINQAFALIKDRGAILCYGVQEKEEFTLDFSKADYNWRLIFQQMPRKDQEGAVTQQIMEWINSGQLVVKDFISDYFEFDDSVNAYTQLLNRKVMKKGIIKF
ncbi:MAG: zinc-binding dehydrogenase [Anaerocolumna sp.]